MASVTWGDTFSGSGALAGSSVEVGTGSWFSLGGSALLRSATGATHTAGSFDESIDLPLSGARGSGVATYEFAVYGDPVIQLRAADYPMVSLSLDSSTDTISLLSTDDSFSDGYDSASIPHPGYATLNVLRIEVQTGETRLYRNGTLLITIAVGASASFEFDTARIRYQSGSGGRDTLGSTSVLLKYIHFKTETTSGALGSPTTGPVMVPPITVDGVTAGSFSISWPAATPTPDEYEISFDGSTYASVGTARSYSRLPLTTFAGDSFDVYVRARAGAAVSAPLMATVTLLGATYAPTELPASDGSTTFGCVPAFAPASPPTAGAIIAVSGDGTTILALEDAFYGIPGGADVPGYGGATYYNSASVRVMRLISGSWVFIAAREFAWPVNSSLRASLDWSGACAVVGYTGGWLTYVQGYLQTFAIESDSLALVAELTVSGSAPADPAASALTSFVLSGNGRYLVAAFGTSTATELRRYAWSSGWTLQHTWGALAYASSPSYPFSPPCFVETSPDAQRIALHVAAPKGPGLGPAQGVQVFDVDTGALTPVFERAGDALRHLLIHNGAALLTVSRIGSGVVEVEEASIETGAVDRFSITRELPTQDPASFWGWPWFCAPDIGSLLAVSLVVPAPDWFTESATSSLYHTRVCWVVDTTTVPGEVDTDGDGVPDSTDTSPNVPSGGRSTTNKFWTGFQLTYEAP